MKIIIIGYGEIFRSTISGIINSDHQIMGVVLHSDVLYNPLRKIFHNNFNPDSDYHFVKSQKLNLIHASSVNSKNFRQKLIKLKPDLIITASWSEKFQQQTLDIPKYGVLNIHPSLLPKYRGPNPYLQAILHAEKTTGVSFHLMDSDFDTGDIIYQVLVNILPSDTGGSLKLRCSDAVRDNIKYVIDNFQTGLKNKIIQNNSDASYQSHITLKDTILNFKEQTSAEISCRIRAFSPWAQCYINIGDEFFSFSNYKITNEISAERAGTIIRKTENSIYITAKDKKIIEFNEIKWLRFNSKLASKLYLKYILKV